VEKIGYIEINIFGSKGSVEIKPDNYDIREVIAMLENAENLLFPNEKKDRPNIAYKIEEGSVRHILKTSIQSIIGFNAILGQINVNNTIDFLDLNTAKSIENIQEISYKKGYSFNIKTSIQNTNELKINSTTKFIRADTIWIDAEFYFYGKLTNAGGKDKANIHILTDDYGSLRVETPITFLENIQENILYKSYGVRVLAKQHAETGEIDKASLSFIELIDYHPRYDNEYLQSLRKKASKSWIGKINADNWLTEIRGGYDA